MEKTKGELIGEFHNKMVTTTIKELSSDGVRMEVNIEGLAKCALISNPFPAKGPRRS